MGEFEVTGTAVGSTLKGYFDFESCVLPVITKVRGRDVGSNYGAIPVYNGLAPMQFTITAPSNILYNLTANSDGMYPFVVDIGTNTFTTGGGLGTHKKEEVEVTGLKQEHDLGTIAHQDGGTVSVTFDVVKFKGHMNGDTYYDIDIPANKYEENGKNMFTGESS